jgi:hypothetical protein
MAGAGKRTALQEALRALAAARGLPFALQTRILGGQATETSTEADADAPASEDSAAGTFTYETSLVHIGLDIAKMSMKDKHILRPILTNLGQGSQVLAGEQGRGSRILVLYGAHLLSSESVLLLQACLEQNEGDLSLWMTSELPVPQRIRDWFVEIPVAGPDYTFEEYKAMVAGSGTEVLADWPTVFRAIVDRWRRAPPPKLSSGKEVKAYVYEMLMRNLRWVEAVHFLLDVIVEHPDLTDKQRGAALAALAACEATGGGYTIPSYRIPILWESLFLQLRSILAREEPLPEADGAETQPAAAATATPTVAGGPTPAAPTPRAGRTPRPRKKAVGAASTAVGAV